MRASTGSAAPTYGQALGTNATSAHRDGNKRFCSVPCAPSFHFENSSTRTVIDFQRAAKCFFDVTLVPNVWSGGGDYRTCTGTHSYSTTAHHVKFFCHLHHRSYYVVMLRYFFRILFVVLLQALQLAIFVEYFSMHSAFGLVIHHNLF